MIHNNIIIPLKHPYISPEVTFEEMEGESMICNSIQATGGDGENGDVKDPEEPSDPNCDIEEAKSSVFIWEDEFINLGVR